MPGPTPRRVSTEKEAREALAGHQTTVANGMFVARSTVTVEQVCAAYLNGCHNLRPTSRAKLAYDLAPLRERHGSLPVQRLTKAHLDALIRDLVAGGTRTGKGRTRKPWSPASVNKVIATAAQVLTDAHHQGIVTRNVAAMVARVSVPYGEVDTFTEQEVHQLLAATADDRELVPAGAAAGGGIGPTGGLPRPTSAPRGSHRAAVSRRCGSSLPARPGCDQRAPLVRPSVRRQH